MLLGLHAARRALAAVACAAAVGWPALARADDSADELARRHFDSGAAYLEESDYDNALKAFQKAYELSRRLPPPPPTSTPPSPAASGSRSPLRRRTTCRRSSPSASEVSVS